MQSYGQLHNTVHYITQIMRMDESVCEFVASPTDNAFWFGRCRCIFHVGGTALLSSGILNPLGMVAALNRHNGNAIGGDTGIYMLLLHHMEKHLARLGPSIRWAKVASAPMPVEDKLRLMQLLPNAWIVMNYGLTEAMRTCLHPFRESPEKLASVGRPCPSVALRIADSEGNEVPAEAIGEVLIGGGNLASGYWRNEELWKARFHDGWYHSGDLGHLDKDGFLFVHGRIDHAINSGGKTISLHEVEQLVRPFMRNTSFVASAAPDPKGVLGDVVVLCVEGRWNEPLPWSELRIKLFEAMEQLLVPVAAYAVPQFPRTSNGKIRLTELRKSIESGQCENLEEGGVTSNSGFDSGWETRYHDPAYRNHYPWSSVVSFVFRNRPKGRAPADVGIVEVGCGTGSNLWFAAREGYRAAGIDGSATAIAFARDWFSREGLHCDFQVGDYTKLPFAGDSFDLAIDRAALTFTGRAEVARALSELKRVLKPGGRLMFTPYSDRCTSFDGLPDADGCYRNVTRGSIRPGVQVCFYSLEDVKRTLVDGWEIKTLEHNEQTDFLGTERTVHAEWHVIAERL